MLCGEGVAVWALPVVSESSLLALASSFRKRRYVKDELASCVSDEGVFEHQGLWLDIARISCLHHCNEPLGSLLLLVLVDLECHPVAIIEHNLLTESLNRFLFIVI
ncbi:hypothetical protein H6G97_09325 [Nostoc flagelliforme FACHB-838]|uniref:Uncharacterized protein n=1 Tax=Nostoc flagelliforme FACHB-838 TaxID=2692904 RepID=A0ABR8DMJ0_9NOSO|nr:hypothetical protein [Nostoc flagelliforme]MBD2529754.1 hypothetical protein [Nostoc flagelliforme FACHB-838]